ncbi:MAG TPA: aryl-sulfate sulfotransferase, partial [Gemmatimonadaceae bacterium]|nr:aryl-sulfate sulfotransferase [Gemmatimonadaceae bacterium]
MRSRPLSHRPPPSIVAAAMLVVAGCNDLAGVARYPGPTIATAVVATDAHAAIAALVTVHGRGLDSVVVRYQIAGAAGPAMLATPAVRAVADSAAVPVLGLLPEQHYELRATGYGAKGTTESAPLTLTTGSLPTDLPRYTASGSDPSPGYVVFAAGKYGVVIDNSGRIVWYRRFDDGVGLSFMAEPDGRYALRPATPAVGDVEPWVELDVSGNVVRSLSCAHGLQTRPHDLIVDTDGSYVILCDETRTMDLSAIGGVAAARVTGTVVQRIGAQGELLFEWSPFDHLAISDLTAAERTGSSVNWTHGNAIDRDADGNLLVSFRSLNEITKIDARTGAVIWRLGGTRNDFTFLGAGDPPFVHQHGLRAAAAGELLLLDNIGDPTASRAERYAIDEHAHTARLVQSFSAIPSAIT